MNDVVGHNLYRQILINNELIEEQNSLLKKLIEKLGSDEE